MPTWERYQQTTLHKKHTHTHTYTPGRTFLWLSFNLYFIYLMKLRHVDGTTRAIPSPSASPDHLVDAHLDCGIWKFKLESDVPCMFERVFNGMKNTWIYVWPLFFENISNTVVLQYCFSNQLSHSRTNTTQHNTTQQFQL